MLDVCLHVCHDVIANFGMNFNEAKSDYVRCAIRCSNACSDIMLGREVIDKLDDIKYLGIEFVVERNLELTVIL